MWANNQHSYPLGSSLFPFLFFGGKPDVGLLFPGFGFPFPDVGLPFPGFGFPFPGVGLPSTGGGGLGGGGPTHNC